MEECAVLEIFGQADNASALITLADEAEVDGLALDWNVRSPASEIVKAMVEASDDGEWLRLVVDDCDDLERTRKACKEAGLSYIHTRGISGDEGYHSAAFWAPGWEKEFETGLLNGVELGLSLVQVKHALDVGPRALHALIQDYERNTLATLEKSLRLSPEVVSELKSAVPTL
jgi:hypothetical protein